MTCAKYVLIWVLFGGVSRSISRFQYLGFIMFCHTFSSIVLLSLISSYVAWFRLLEPAAMAEADGSGVLEDDILCGILLACLRNVFFIV